MGIGMAHNLQNHLAQVGAPPLMYSNRTLSKGEPLQAAGGKPQPDFKTLVEQCDVIFTMVRVDVDSMMVGRGQTLTTGR